MALLAAASASVLWVPVPVAALAVASVGIAFLVDLWFQREAPTVERRYPTEVVRGQPTPFAVAVSGVDGDRCEVRQVQGEMVRFSPATGRASLEGTLVVAERGRHPIGQVVTRTTGPLGLARRTRTHRAEVWVGSHADLPAARRLAIAVREGRFREEGLRRGPLGLGTDFETIREYQPDDDIRRINWSATERTGHPMVNQFREDTQRDVWCLLDSGRLLASPVGDRTRLDLALDALAAVAAVAEAVGDQAGAVVFGAGVDTVIRPRRGNAAGLVRSIEHVAATPIDSDYDAAFRQVAGAKRALVVVFTDLFDPAAVEPLADAVPVLVRRHAVVVASVVDPDLVRAVVREPSDSTDVRRASVATRLLDDSARAASMLEHAGAVVVQASADSLASTTVAAYLRLKARARL